MNIVDAVFSKIRMPESFHYYRRNFGLAHFPGSRQPIVSLKNQFFSFSSIQDVHFQFTFFIIHFNDGSIRIFLFDPNLDIRSDRHIRTPFLFRHFIHGFDQIAVTDIIQVGIQSFFFEFDDIHCFHSSPFDLVDIVFFPGTVNTFLELFADGLWQGTIPQITFRHHPFTGSVEPSLVFDTVFPEFCDIIPLLLFPLYFIGLRILVIKCRNDFRIGTILVLLFTTGYCKATDE